MTYSLGTGAKLLWAYNKPGVCLGQVRPKQELAKVMLNNERASVS